MLKMIVGKYLQKGRRLFAAFMELEEAYERVNRKGLWDVFRDPLHPLLHHNEINLCILCSNVPTIMFLFNTYMKIVIFQDSPFFQQYELDLRENILGDGSFSVCRECIQKSTGQHFAVKIVSRKLDCQQEINLLRACQGHSNIVNLHEVFYDEVRSHT